MNNNEMLGQLKCQSTWRLFFLSIITLGIYTAHYIKRQTEIINQYLDEPSKISGAFVKFTLILAYVSVFLIVPFIMVDEGHAIGKISDLADRIWAFLVLIWAFTARSKMNTILVLTKDQSQWFHGLWTFLFSAFYFNFKINQLNNIMTEQD